MKNLEFAIILLIIGSSVAGPMPAGIYYPGCCGSVIVACYSVAGFTFGTVTIDKVTPALEVCNALFRSCLAALEAAWLMRSKL